MEKIEAGTLRRSNRLYSTAAQTSGPNDNSRGWWLVFLLLSFILLGGYYASTIAANSFWGDQYKLIEYSKEILAGNFRLVGMRTSRLNWNFPMIHYLLTPLVAFTADLWTLYFSTALTYIFGVWSLSRFLLKYRPLSEFLIFAMLSLTHVWSLFYSSFAWPPNYIPLFVSLFFICFFHYLKHSEKVWLFHLAAVFLNIAFQLHTMSVVLIIGFVTALPVLGKLPRYRHWILQISIQIFLVSPWLIYHFHFIDWNNEPEYHSSLFKNFISPAEALMNYLSGSGLTREYTLNLNYGTNTFPYENFWSLWLSVGGWLLLLLIFWTLWQIHPLLKARGITRQTFHRRLLPYYREETDINRAYPLAVCCLFLPTLLYLVSGIVMEPHYYQFLTPILFLLVAMLPGQLATQTLRKLAWCGIVFVVFIQGGFSYWRAWEEQRSPYLDDIGYTHILAQTLAEQCRDVPQIRFISTYGLRSPGPMFRYRFDPQLDVLKKTGTLDCQTVFVFQNKLPLQSPVIAWYLQQLTPVKKREVHNNQIWIVGSR